MGDVLAGNRLQAGGRGGIKEGLLLGAHGCSLYRQCCLRPLVVTTHLVVAEGELVAMVIHAPVTAIVTGEYTGHGPRAVTIVVQGGAADTGDLGERPRGCLFAEPSGFRRIRGTKAKLAGQGAVHVVFQGGPLLLRVGMACASLQHQHIQAALGQLFCYNGAAATGANNNYITHQTLLRPWK